MTFSQLEYVVEIFRCGSINKAANKLFISQTGMSSAVKNLEDELGFKLFNRSNRGVTFTPKGEDFLKHATSLLDQKQYIENLYCNASVSEAGTSLAVSAQRFSRFLEALTAVVNDTCSRSFSFTYREENLDDVIQDIYTNRADIGLISRSPSSRKIIGRQLKLLNLEFHQLITVTPKIYCRTGHPLTKLDVVHECDLYEYPYIYYELGAGSAIEFAEECPIIEPSRTNKTICVNNSGACNSFLRNTDGFTIGSGFCNAERSTGISIVPLSDISPMTIGWIKPQDSYLNPLQAEYIRNLEKIVEKLNCN